MVEEKTQDSEKADRRSWLKWAAGALGGLALASAFRARETPSVMGADGATVTVGNTVEGTNPSSNSTRITGHVYLAGPLAPTFEATNDQATGAVGVRGYCSSAAGTTYGVYGETSSPTGRGVYGKATGTGVCYGVVGENANSTSGIAIHGAALASTGETVGVRGFAQSTSGIGVMGMAGNASTKPLVARGYAGQIANLQEWQNSVGTALSVVDKDGRIGAGITSPGASVHGHSSTDSGVKGSSIANVGVYGESQNHAGIKGVGYGAGIAAVLGENLSEAGLGVAGNNSSSSGVGVKGFNTSGIGVQGEAETGIGVHGLVTDPTGKPIIAQGASDQTANLQEWQNNAGAALSVIDKSGWLGIGTSTPAALIHVTRDAPNPVVVEGNGSVGVSVMFDNYYGSGGAYAGGGFLGRMARGTKASPANVATGDRLGFNVFGGYAGGAFRHVAAIEALVDSGTVSASSLPSAIRFLTASDGSIARQERMRIDKDGNVVPPGDNKGNIGTASKRWALVRAVTVTSGDLIFENGYRVTEDKESGLLFLNQKGERIARFDERGNLRIKGKFIEES